jgi:hypothetical protein
VQVDGAVGIDYPLGRPGSGGGVAHGACSK